MCKHKCLSTHLGLLLLLLLLGLLGEPVELLLAHAELEVSVFAHGLGRKNEEEAVKTRLIS